MAKIRVLVVDDAVVVRKIVSDVLAEDPEIEVVGSVPNGKVCLERIHDLRPDIITLDVEMPELDGIETLRAMRKSNLKVPVIMFSATTERGAQTTLEALSLGASDYVTKPTSVGAVASAKSQIKSELVAKIKGLVLRTRPRILPQPAPQRAAAPVPSAPVVTPLLTLAPQVLAIGVSTGGPNALAELLPKLPARLPVPILITQHMPPIFTRMLAERLSLKTKFPVVEAQQGMSVVPGTAYLAPGDFHMLLRGAPGKHTIELTQSPPENSCRPAVDVMLRSVGDAVGGRALVVILTGMGSDGLKGCEQLRKLGATVLAQDEASSVVWGMPGAVVGAGLATSVAPLAELPAFILQKLKAGGDSRQRGSPPSSPRGGLV